jgi:hypothetical protein
MESGAEEYFEGAARWLKAEKVHLERGLSDSEVATIEARYEFRLPADLRMLLQIALPLSAPRSKRVWIFMADAGTMADELEGMPNSMRHVRRFRLRTRRRQRPRAIPWSFPDWRARRQQDLVSLDELVTKPFDYATWYLAQEIERGYWDTRWGTKTDDLQEAKRQMAEYVHKAPKMIPLGSAFYMSSEPSEAGNPVWEYFIEDLQYYAGFDLPGFLHYRFDVPLPSWSVVVPRWIDFWSEDLHHSPGRTPREAYDLFVRYILEDPDPAAARERFFRGQPEPFIPEGDERPEWADKYG